uniref:DUF7378 domain-containing protein n=1 Tax=Oryza rufipogon TaxID=4529 RepID=A0A0E0N1V3_ORYRU
MPQCILKLHHPTQKIVMMLLRRSAAKRLSRRFKTLTTSTILGLPVEDERVVMACAGVLVVLVAGLLAYWRWIVRKYGDKPVDPAPKLVEALVSVDGSSGGTLARTPGRAGKRGVWKR